MRNWLTAEIHGRAVDFQFCIIFNIKLVGVHLQGIAIVMPQFAHYESLRFKHEMKQHNSTSAFIVDVCFENPPTKPEKVNTSWQQIFAIENAPTKEMMFNWLPAPRVIGSLGNSPPPR